MNARWRIRTRIASGDIGALVRLHGVLYAREYGFDRTFEAYVAAGLAEFVASFRPGRDRLWLAEEGGRIVGSVAIAARPRGRAQLRWFLVDPSRRGRGLGASLLLRAIRFCRGCGYGSIYLWTTSELRAAAHLYVRFGFRRTARKTHRTWGRRVTEERYDLRLRAAP